MFMNNEKPTKPQLLSGLGHAIASVYTLAAQIMEPDWSEWTPSECAAAMDGPVQHLRSLAPHLEKLQREAGATILQQALFLARAQVHATGGIVGNALAVARAGAVLNHWLRTIASLHSQEAGSDPLTLGEIFERVQRTNQDSRQSMLSKTKPNNALSRPAHTI